MAKDRLKTKHTSPWVAWIAMGVLLAMVVGLLATYVLRPGRSPAQDAETADAIRRMDEAQTDADAKRDKKRSATSLL